MGFVAFWPRLGDKGYLRRDFHVRDLSQFNYFECTCVKMLNVVTLLTLLQSVISTDKRVRLQVATSAMCCIRRRSRVRARTAEGKEHRNVACSRCYCSSGYLLCANMVWSHLYPNTRERILGSSLVEPHCRQCGTFQICPPVRGTRFPVHPR